MPTPFVLLHDWMWWMASTVTTGTEPISEYFRPPVNCPGSSIQPPRDISEDLDRRKAYRDEYEAQYAQTNAILEALPTDWKDRYLKEFDSMSEGNIIRGLIRGIKPELRLRMEGLEEWLCSPDSEDEDYEPQDVGNRSEDDGEDVDQVEGTDNST